MKFNNYQEMYDMLQACHGCMGEDYDEEDYDEKDYCEDLYEELFKMSQESEDSTFGSWSGDWYERNDGRFCYEYTHNNKVDGKTYVFKFFDDGSDTIKDDMVFDSEDEAFDSTIDYGFLNAIAAMLGKDPIK
jgi:hypothetical protein